jgi:putative transposase
MTQLSSSAPGLPQEIHPSFGKRPVARLPVSSPTIHLLAPAVGLQRINWTVRKLSRNIKRWKDGQMTLRWVAGALIDTKRRFRKLRGHRDMKLLLTALKANFTRATDAQRKAAKHHH